MNDLQRAHDLEEEVLTLRDQFSAAVDTINQLRNELLVEKRRNTRQSRDFAELSLDFESAGWALDDAREDIVFAYEQGVIDGGGRG